MAARNKPAAGKNKKQAVSLARRMAGKKGAVVQLQAEINSEEDWEKLLGRDGLIVVDIYSDWCGPCVGMVGNLKKCKLEIGGDLLHLAIAKADEIDVLKRFRNKSEPTWMFIEGGKLLHVLFGANAPRLMQLIEAELKILQKGTQDPNRVTYRFDELTPEEQARAAALAKQRAEEAAEAAARELALKNEERDRLYGQMIVHLLNETVAVCLPHTVGPEGCEFYPHLEAMWSQIGVNIADMVRMEVTSDIWDEIIYREDIELTDDLKSCLSLGPCFALLLRCNLSPPVGVEVPEAQGDVEKLVWECLNMNKIQPDQPLSPHPESIPAKYFWKREIPVNGADIEKGDGLSNGNDDIALELKLISKKESLANGSEQPEMEVITTNVVGVFTPVSALSKCAAVAKLFPARAQKIALTESKTLPPRVALVFELDKSEECFALAQEIPDEVVAIAYFDKGDPEEALLIAKSQKQYAKLEQNQENKLVVIVAKRQSEPMLSFAALGPIYMSPDETVGAVDSDKFFPPGVELDVNSDEEGEENDAEGTSDLARACDGGLTPVTAVTAK